MNLNQFRKEIAELRAMLAPMSHGCVCKYIEQFQDELQSAETLLIIESNQRCRLHDDRNHVGFSAISIASINDINI